MPRRSGVPKRDVLPDPIYNSKVVTKLINQIMLDGKKGTAQAIVYEALNIAAAKLGQEPMDIFNKALENAMPMLEVKARRVGGSTYQVPMGNPSRTQTNTCNPLDRSLCQKERRKTMDARLAGELMDAFNMTGGAVKRKDEMHRAAEANKAFAHYRW